ncbi:hypothetical protein KAR34_03885 [bacterium]|nr:hypothetical protein [bacterium]
MHTRISKQDWLNEMSDATFVLSQTILGTDDYTVKTKEPDFPKDDVLGAYIPLVGEKDAVLIGVLSNQQGMKELAQSFLGLEPGAEELSKEDIVDAIKEILNILCGIVKRQMVEHNPILKSGLPVFVEGYFELRKNQEFSCSLVEIGEVKIHLIIIRSQSEGFQQDEPQGCDVDAKMTAQDWLNEMSDATFELSQTILGIDDYAVKTKEPHFPQDDVLGTYIPLVGEGDAVLIGILSNQQGMQELARSFLGLEPGDNELTKEDMVDAVGEVLNILCGIVKRRIIDRRPVLWTGMPNFIEGNIELTKNQESACALVEIGTVKIYLIVIRRLWKTAITH